MDELREVDAEEVRARAAAEADLELEERLVAGEWVFGWARGDDTRFPCFRTEGEAVRYMDDRLRRTKVFE